MPRKRRKARPAASEEEGTKWDLPEPALVRIARFAGLPDLPSLLATCKGFRAGIHGHPAVWGDSLREVSTRTAGPCAATPEARFHGLPLQAAAHAVVRAPSAWAAGAFASDGVSYPIAGHCFSCLAWAGNSMPSAGAGPQGRLLLAGASDGSLSILQACTHDEGGAVHTPDQVRLRSLRHCRLEQHTGLVSGVASWPVQPEPAPDVDHHRHGAACALSQDAPQWSVGVPDGDAFVATSSHDGTVRVSRLNVTALREQGPHTTDPEILQPRHSWGEPAFGASVNGVSACSYGPVLACAVDSGSVVLTDPHSGSVLSTFAAHKRSVSCVSFAPEASVLSPSLLASGGFDTCARLWDVRDGGPAVISLPQLPEEALKRTGWTGSRVVATPQGGGADDEQSDGQDRPRGIHEHHVPLPGHPYRVYDARWSPDGLLLATTGGDCAVRVWDVRYTSEPLFTHRRMKRWVESVAWLNGSRALAGAGQDWNLRVWGHERFRQPHASPPTMHPMVGTGASAIVDQYGQPQCSSRGGSPLRHSLPTVTCQRGIVDRHTSLVLSLCSDGEDTLVSCSADGCLTLRVLQPFTHQHVPALAQRPHFASWRRGRTPGAAARHEPRARSGSPRSSTISAESAGAARLAAGSEAGPAARHLCPRPLRSAVARGEEVQHTALKPAAMDAMAKALPSVSWQQGGSGTAHLVGAMAMARKSLRSTRERWGKLPLRQPGAAYKK